MAFFPTYEKYLLLLNEKQNLITSSLELIIAKHYIISRKCLVTSENNAFRRMSTLLGEATLPFSFFCVPFQLGSTLK